MEPKDFDKILNGLLEKYQLQSAPVVGFNRKNIEHFCNDLSDFINAFLSHFREKFGLFYNRIECTITGDKLSVASVVIEGDSPELIQYFDSLDPLASIRIRFTLTNPDPRILRWGTIHRDIFVHFRYNDFEILYNVPTAEPIYRVKEYGSYIYDITELFRDLVRNDIIASMFNRDGRIN